MKLWRDWFPDLLPHVPGCPNVLAKHELLRTAQVFMEGTRAWQLRMPIPVFELERSIALTPISDAIEIVRVESVYFEKRKIHPITADELDAKFNDDWLQHTGTPERYYQLQPGFIELYPNPVAASDALVVRVSVSPSDMATGLPDDIASRYWDQIHLGAKSRLMLMPNKQWTNAGLGAALGQAFTALLDTANAHAARSFGKARIPSKVKWC